MNFLSSPVNRALVIGAIAVIIALFAYFSVVQPTLASYNAATARLAQDEQNYSDLKRVADQKPVYLALTKQIQSRLTGVELTADPRVYIPSYLKQIEDLAKQDGLQVTSVTPQATPSPSPGPSGAPGASPVPQAVSQIAPIASARRALGSEAAQSQVTSGVAATTGGATPIPALPAAPVAGPGGPGGPAQAGSAGSSARANAIAYLNQSFSQVPINMELSGTYSEIQKFLRDLNKFPKLIGVGNMTMTPGSHQDVGQTPTLNIILPIVAYRLSPSGAGQMAPIPPSSSGAATPVRNGG
jgi:Tfp pilus assembly protein PilO